MFANLAYECNEELSLKCDEVLHNEDPTTIHAVAKREDHERWSAAMHDELNSLHENQTWNLTELPPGRKTVKTKWVFKTKRNNDGEVVRYKARLVAKGYTQRPGIDYGETYAPVVRYTSVRFLIALAVQRGLKIHQMDAITAFLQGDLDEEIYLEQPDGFKDKTGRVCKLNRAIYGLKQAGRQWSSKLNEKLEGFGLIKCVQDPCIFYSRDSELIVAIYVDDLLIFYKHEADLTKIKNNCVMCSR